ncbi:MAG: carbohydrate kinase family protein [Acidobacteriaceae bacterium]|nr:carbohydrate kinase family protein [Acidobacteriaceae bacterium]
MANESSESKVDLVGVGLNTTDTVLSLSHYPERGSKVELRGITVLPGGQVATTVVACQHWGMTTRYVGKLGDDAAAALHHDAFSREGVELRLLTAPNCTSHQSLILVDNQGERTVLWRRDGALALRPADLKREWIVNARVLHVDGFDTEAATQAATWAREAGVPVVADLDEIYAGIENLLPLVDYLIVNSEFPERLTGNPDLESSLRQMQHRYGSRLTAATLGQGGVLAFDGQSFHSAAAYKVPIVDTTGAGDLFRAGFIYGLLQAWPLDRQLDFACAAAGLNCMFAGARGGIQSIEAVENLMATVTRYPVAECAIKD